MRWRAPAASPSSSPLRSPSRASSSPVGCLPAPAAGLSGRNGAPSTSATVRHAGEVGGADPRRVEAELAGVGCEVAAQVDALGQRVPPLLLDVHEVGDADAGARGELLEADAALEAQAAQEG